MPGPRNPKKQKKQKAVKEKKRQYGTHPSKTEAKPATTPTEEDGNVLPLEDPAPQVEKDTVVTTDVERRVGLEGRPLLREPPIYDPGTGPRVKSMGEFLRSSFASEPTLEDELCAEFAQEEMLEMLSEVLPEEIALVSVK